MLHESKQRRTLRLGTRGSQLARWQAEWVAGELQRLGHAVELVEIATRGDVEQRLAIEEIGTRGVFTKEIQRALLAGIVDMGVHSLKDLPTEPVAGLMLAAVPVRESAADVLVVAASREQGAGSSKHEAESFSVLHAPCSMLPHGARVGTGSLRRLAQLRHLRPDLKIGDVRGNVDTRLRKLDEGQFDAIVLAEAGLRRLGLARRATYVLPFDVMLPAVGQGALGIECRADDAATRAAVASLEDADSRAAVTAERALLAHLRGGCMAPVGAWGRVESGQLQLAAVVLSADGKERLVASDSAAPEEAEALGQRVATELIAQGADKLIASSRLGFPA
ncbi:MAG: hydroxymethylbilane synthase [Planctomycetes bacterium]|nr:hydroxymethylbilane synthase [Planctomycetota bacterium]